MLKMSMHNTLTLKMKRQGHKGSAKVGQGKDRFLLMNHTNHSQIGRIASDKKCQTASGVNSKEFDKF